MKPESIITIATLVILVIALGMMSMYEKRRSNEMFDAWMLERDCRFELEMFIRRERGEHLPKSSYDLCDLDPLDINCTCARVKDK